MKSKYHTQPLIALALLSVASLATVNAQEPPASPPVTPAPPSEEATKVQKEWLEVQGKLQQVEQQAAVRPEVVAESDKLTVMLEKSMTEKDPALEPKLKESKELLAKLRTDPELAKPQAEQSPEFVESMRRFQSLETELAEKRNQIVATEPEVKSQYKVVQNVMVEEMTKIEPETPQLLAKRESLAKQFQELQ